MNQYNHIGISVAASLIASLGTGIGAVAIVLTRQLKSQHQGILVGLGGGIMLAAATFSLIWPGFVAAQSNGYDWSSAMCLWHQRSYRHYDCWYDLRRRSTQTLVRLLAATAVFTGTSRYQLAAYLVISSGDWRSRSVSSGDSQRARRDRHSQFSRRYGCRSWFRLRQSLSRTTFSNWYFATKPTIAV